jgi:hypothetical protein
MAFYPKLSAAAALVLLFAAPLMACLTPDAQLTAEEKACCRAMAGQCGDMGPSGHSCCDEAAPADTHIYLSSCLHHTPQLSSLPLCLSNPETLSGVSTTLAVNYIANGHSPPLQDDFQILRI